jgi:hypothetical protein
VKIIFLIIGLALVAGFLFIASYFFRLGKPIDAEFSDSYYFHRWKNKIIYSPMGNWFELGYLESTADPKTFKVISTEYGKDEDSVFWKGKAQVADVKSFTIDQYHIPKDKNHVYYDVLFTESLVVIEGADPATYQPLPVDEQAYYEQWGIDDYSVFVDGKKIDVDRKSFERLNRTLAVDSNYVYAIVNKIVASEPRPGAMHVQTKTKRPEGTATTINENYARLGNSILLSNWKNEFAQLTYPTIDSVRVIDERNIIVNGSLISDGNQMPEVDMLSFEVLDRDYFKDKNSVYYDTKKINEALPQTFVLIADGYAKDDKRVYYQEKIVEGADAIRFSYQDSNGVATDSTFTYKNGMREKKVK